MTKYVYLFTEGNADMRNLLGGKGANLAEMTNIGLPVPQGFTITTEACTKYYEDGRTINDEIQSQINEYIVKMEEITGKKFGDKENPLLVSVRSGARASMPGMMDTILNLGLNEEVVNVLAEKSNNPRWAWDCYRRFIQMYSDVVMEVGKKYFEQLIDKMKEEKNVKLDVELTADDLKELAREFKEEYKSNIGEDFPDDPKEQLMGAIKAVFRSWDNPRANVYRRDNDIPYSWGTAVNVQSMAFGNMGDDCGTGVAFTRDPATGEKGLFGEFLTNAQGEDVVAGVRTPMKITEMADKFPEAFEEFKRVCATLEEHYRDMQDMEFTIENGKLYMLQTRNGKRTGKAAIKIVVDLIKENIITKEEGILRITSSDIDSMLHRVFDENELNSREVVTKGLAASPGAGSGKIYFSAKDVKSAYDKGERNIVLVRLETSPEDIEGMNLSKAVVTVRGGMTSHAAVVARGMGIPCVSGCENLLIDEANKTVIYNGKTLTKDDYISVDGASGIVYLGEVPVKNLDIDDYFKEFMSYVDEYMKVVVRANADNEKDAKRALELGAKGIGLCRTEHMFFSKERIFNFRKMILASNEVQRKKALDKILPYQREDFYHLFKVMNGFPVTIRLLDPPLHEFLPKTNDETQELAKSLGISVNDINDEINKLKEFNPMMGHRGCRLAITYPEIAEMQTKAIVEAYIKAKKEGILVKPEIMVPLVGEVNELEYVKCIINDTINKLTNEKFMIGTMIEVPRGAITADKIAKHADFFSFGTNDLTQMTFGFSRDDSGKFLNDYYDKKILTFNPFKTLDKEGVGYLIKEAVKKGKEANSKIELGICGEQGADENSIFFLKDIGIDYVSCSPYRVPCAKLASAKASISKE